MIRERGMISYSLSLKTLKSSLEFIVHVVVDKVRDDVPEEEIQHCETYLLVQIYIRCT